MTLWTLSADEIGEEGYDNRTGYGRVNAVAANVTLGDILFLAAVEPAATSFSTAEKSSLFSATDNNATDSLLDLLHLSMESQADCSTFVDFFTGRLDPSTELIRLSLDRSEADGWAPIPAQFNFDPTGIGGLESLGLNGGIAALLFPELHVSFGFDGSGFFLDADHTVIGAKVTGMAEASGELGGLAVSAVGSLEMHPSLSFAPVGGKLRVGEILNHLDSLDLSLGQVSADLRVDLAADLLDYIDADGNPDNKTVHGGDPFRFAATTSLTGTTWDGIRLLNPDVDQNGFDDFTAAVFMNDIQRLIEDAVRGNRTEFLQELLDGFQPAATSSGRQPDRDALQLARKLPSKYCQHRSLVCRWLRDVQQWLNNGLPADPAEIVRLRVHLDSLALDPLTDLAENFTASCPMRSPTA